MTVTPSTAPPSFGDRYTMVRPLATGGMAEIFLARQKALAGFEKDVVVKQLYQRYRADRRVVEMFLDEARIGAQLNHPNIVHVYDVGEHDGTPYIAMELIHGEELSTLCRRGLELGLFLPFQHAIDLMRQAAEGMGYFHAVRGIDGKRLDIVHRDISPSNLLVTRDGGLKIIDFGIARSRLSRATDDKAVPGKYNYMAPEQVRGERIDHRADIFSLGIVLYEITVGKRLFKGRPEEVMQKITRGKWKPPTFIRRDFPAPLEKVVVRALEMHADDRYQSAYELAADLEEVLRELKLKSGPMRVAQYLDDLEAAAGKDRRPELVTAGKAWLDDDHEDALDFNRSFGDVKNDSRSVPAVKSPTGRAAAEAWDDDADAPDTERPVVHKETESDRATTEKEPETPAPVPAAVSESPSTSSPSRSSPSPSASPSSHFARPSFGDGIVHRAASPMRWLVIGGIGVIVLIALIVALTR
jgi:serine/threonine protein kinase